MEGGANYTVEDLLIRAEELLQSLGNVELAEKFYAKALALEPENTAIMDDYAECLMELGDVEKAAWLLQQSIEKDPNGGYQKYMNAGQLSGGMEALTCFNRGIELMIEFHKNPPQDPRNKVNVEDLPNQISAGYCSMAEIFMTDCCFEEGAEEECTRLIEEAIKWNSRSVEGYLLKAQCFLAKSDPAQALPAILSSHVIWQNSDPVDWPPYPIRVSTAKVFIELSEIERATELLEQLTHEDDEDSEVWYLLGLCYYNLDDPECLPDAIECLNKAKNILSREENQIEGALAKVQTLLDTVNSGIGNSMQAE